MIAIGNKLDTSSTRNSSVMCTLCKEGLIGLMSIKLKRIKNDDKSSINQKNLHTCISSDDIFIASSTIIATVVITVVKLRTIEII